MHKNLQSLVTNVTDISVLAHSSFGSSNIPSILQLLFFGSVSIMYGSVVRNISALSYRLLILYHTLNYKTNNIAEVTCFQPNSTETKAYLVLLLRMNHSCIVKDSNAFSDIIVVK